MKKRAVIYARVSTRDKKQEPESQIMHLREVADLRGFDLVGVYFDKQSGARMDRKEYQAMRLAARRREFDVLLVWSYNRFARSAIELLMALEEFQRGFPGCRLLSGDHVSVGRMRQASEGPGRPERQLTAAGWGWRPLASERLGSSRSIKAAPRPSGCCC